MVHKQLGGAPVLDEVHCRRMGRRRKNKNACYSNCSRCEQGSNFCWPDSRLILSIRCGAHSSAPLLRHPIAYPLQKIEAEPPGWKFRFGVLDNCSYCDEPPVMLMLSITRGFSGFWLSINCSTGIAVGWGAGGIEPIGFDMGMLVFVGRYFTG